MEARVCLLSDLARYSLEKPADRPTPRGFWSGLSALLCGETDHRRGARPCPSEDDFGRPSTAEGYEPFCKIGDVRILVKDEGAVRFLAIMEGDRLWDISEWGKESTFRSRLVAEVYFMVTKDDFRIDDQEVEVLRALFAFFDVSADEVATAKELVYWTLVENAMEDGIITGEEWTTMTHITTALELSAEDQLELHRRAVEQRFDELFTRPAGAPLPTEADIMAICEMAHRFGIAEEFVARKAEEARARLIVP